MACVPPLIWRQKAEGLRGTGRRGVGAATASPRTDDKAEAPSSLQPKRLWEIGAAVPGGTPYHVAARRFGAWGEYTAEAGRRTGRTRATPRLPAGACPGQPRRRRPDGRAKASGSGGCVARRTRQPVVTSRVARASRERARHVCALQLQPADGVEEGDHDRDGGDEVDEDTPERGECHDVNWRAVRGVVLEAGQQAPQVDVGRILRAVPDLLDRPVRAPDPADKERAVETASTPWTSARSPPGCLGRRSARRAP